jgi:hypothetical protein
MVEHVARQGTAASHGRIATEVRPAATTLSNPCLEGSDRQEHSQRATQKRMGRGQRDASLVGGEVAGFDRLPLSPRKR